MQLGEAFVGEGAHAAHVNTVLGPRDGPVGTAWATALATPTAGHAPFVVIAQPDVPVQPFTLFVNKAAIADDGHARLTWGAAQAGVAEGVIDAVAAGLVPFPHEMVLIAAVWVDPKAVDATAVRANNGAAMFRALERSAAGHPSADDVAAVRTAVWNAFTR